MLHWFGIARCYLLKCVHFILFFCNRSKNTWTVIEFLGMIHMPAANCFRSTLFTFQSDAAVHEFFSPWNHRCCCRCRSRSTYFVFKTIFHTLNTIVHIRMGFFFRLNGTKCEQMKLIQCCWIVRLLHGAMVRRWFCLPFAGKLSTV